MVRKVTALLLVFVIAGCVATAMASTTKATKSNKYFESEQNGFSIIFPEPNEKQLSIIKKLQGKNITLGEYIERVYPELLKKVPEFAKKRLYSSKIVWPTGNITEKKTQSKMDLTQVQPQQLQLIILIHHSAVENPSWPNIKQSSWSYEIWPPIFKINLPFMAVESYLWYKATSDSPSVLKSYTAKSCFNCYEVCAEKTYTASKGGYWSVTGHHWGDYPQGYTPPDYDTWSDSGWYYFGP